MTKKFIVALILSIGTISITLSQSLERQFDQLLNQEFPSSGTGASALVIVDGEIIYHKAFGKANLELDVDMSTNNIFEIGSNTKQFTAVAIMMLAEEGKLNLNDTITKYFNDYPTHGHTIKIHHLLSHTSGLASFTSSDEWYENRNNEMTQEEFMNLFKKTPMLFAPGEKYYYSNTGYFLLGMIIEKISEKPYNDYIDENIFKKVGMKNSTFMNKHKIIKNRAMGHDKIKDKFIKSDEMLDSHAYSAGAILSTTYDLYLWNRAIVQNKLISKESKELAFTNYEISNGKYANYGYGWAINEINGTSTIEHSGGTFGSLSNLIYLPENDVFVVLLSNCVCSSTDFISTKMAAIAINKPYDNSKINKTKISSSFKEEFVGTYKFDNGSTRVITKENNQIFSQLTNRDKMEIYPSGNNTFYYENNLIKLTFKMDESNNPILLYKNRIYEMLGKKVE